MAAPHPVPVTEREYGLDWLRVFAFAVLIFYHSGMIYVSWDFHIKNNETSRALELLMLACNRWRLPLLFFISGAGVWFSLRKREWLPFVRERLKRLGIPIVFGMLVIVPPQIYYERLFRGQYSGSYLDWYPSVFALRGYPEGNLSWHHLWFVVYILVYSLLGIPVFAFLRSGAGRRLVEGLAAAVSRYPAALYALNVPSIAVGLALGPHWPTTHNLVADWANLTGSFVTFLWGFVIASSPRLLDEITRRRRELLAALICTVAIFFGTIFLQRGGLVRQLASAYFGFAAIVTFVGYARHHVRSRGPVLQRATELVYPFYIVHQTVTIAAGYYVIQLPWSVFPKLVVTMLATLFGSLLIVEVARRSAVLRPFFGMRNG